MYIAYTDGACRPNPGRGAYGFVILNESREVYRENGPVGNYTTNNIAEYTALIRALKKASSLGIRSIQVRSDSELMIRQLNGRYRVKDPELKKLFKKVQSLANNFNSISFLHVPREQNREADRLAESCFQNASTRRVRAEQLAQNAFVRMPGGRYFYFKENCFYEIDLPKLSCSCPDRQNRGNLCKHIMAAQMLEQRIKETVFEGDGSNGAGNSAQEDG